MQTLDKSRELVSSIRLINDKLHFHCHVEGNAPISVDYLPPLGDNLGYTSLELLLISLSTCLGSALLVFLRKMQKTISTFEISARGLRNEEHPTCFREIQMEIRLTSPDISEEELKKLVALSEEKYCPVWAMIKGNVAVNVSHRIERAV
jgi:putative redox protein